ncbi:uncharacterized protein V6R79_021831 [Siganus canaliculatus]
MEDGGMGDGRMEGMEAGEGEERREMMGGGGRRGRSGGRRNQQQQQQEEEVEEEKKKKKKDNGLSPPRILTGTGLWKTHWNIRLLLFTIVRKQQDFTDGGLKRGRVGDGASILDPDLDQFLGPVRVVLRSERRRHKDPLHVGSQHVTVLIGLFGRVPERHVGGRS